MENLTGEVLKERVHPAEPQCLAPSASVSCMYGSKHLKFCFYIPNLGVLQIFFHNLDNSLAYTVQRRNREFVASPPLETSSITPKQCVAGHVELLFTSFNKHLMDTGKANATEKSFSNELGTC